MKLGYLGPIGTFSYEAATKYKTSDYIEYKTISEAITALDKNLVEEVIVPVENSIQGGVTETIDKLIEVDNIYIKKEVILSINHNLMTKDNVNLSEIEEVYSHPQALAQCRKYLEENLPNATIKEVSSTARAAKEIEGKSACICSISCKDLYNLNVLGESIQENKNNKTKFWVLSKNKNTEGEKIAVLFSTKDKPGALYKILGLFYENDVNLVKIESRPAKTELGSYIFLVELETNDKVNETLNKVEEECAFYKYLGKY